MAVSESISSGMGWNKRVRKERRENRGVEEDEGGIPGWSAEHPSHLLPTSLVSSSVLAKGVSSKCSSSFLTAKEGKEGFLGSLIFSPVLFPTALLYYLDKCSAILLCSLRVQGSGWRKIYICKCLLFVLRRTVITSGSASRPWLHFLFFGN